MLVIKFRITILFVPLSDNLYFWTSREINYLKYEIQNWYIFHAYSLHSKAKWIFNIKYPQHLFKFNILRNEMCATVLLCQKLKTKTLKKKKKINRTFHEIAFNAILNTGSYSYLIKVFRVFSLNLFRIHYSCSEKKKSELYCFLSLCLWTLGACFSGGFSKCIKWNIRNNDFH